MRLGRENRGTKRTSMTPKSRLSPVSATDGKAGSSRINTERGQCLSRGKPAGGSFDPTFTIVRITPITYLALPARRLACCKYAGVVVGLEVGAKGLKLQKPQPSPNLGWLST